MKTILISILTLILLSCNNEENIIQDKGCECEIKTTVITYDAVKNITRVRHYYEKTDITDCDLDGLAIGDGILECK